MRSLTLFEPVLFSLLVATAPESPATREIRAVASSTTELAARGELDEGARVFIDYWFGEGRWESMPEAARVPIRTGMSEAGARWRALFDDPARIDDFAGLEARTFLLMAQNSRSPARAVSELLDRTLPNRRSLEISGVGHMAPLVNPERVNPLIESFLAGR